MSRGGAHRPAPVATYRLQLTPDLGFADAAAVLPHLAALGVSHLYLSPIGRATAGSQHGYDWVPPPGVADVLGGSDGLRGLRAAADELGLGLIVDIVPNHTGVADARQNPWFADLLARGPESAYAKYFDVDFAPDNGVDGRIALPVLGDETDLDALEIRDGWLHFYDHAYPLAPDTGVGTPAEVHDRQHYRLVPWRSGLIGYRRFFAINELAGVRQEDPEVYDATHGWLRELIADDLVDGVRVDHPDGLWDPQGYLERLRADLGPDRLLYIEKILATDEPLEPSLPVDGTTGYDQLRIIDAVFTAPTGVIALAEIHERLTGVAGDGRWLRSTEHARKLETIAETFPTEHRRLVAAVRADSGPDAEGFPVPGEPELLSTATAEIIADLGVYRADYPALRSRLEATAARVSATRPGLAGAVATVVEATGRHGAASARLAQTGGAVTAKSVEDSLFYRTARLVSAQEVGGDPAEPAVDLRDFHAHNEARAERWPLAMTASSTHDTKRSEDVRARIAILAQVPERWTQLVDALWRDQPPPHRLTGYFLLQNFIGVWPVDGPVTDDLRERLHAYAEKAIRESGLRTTWTDIDDDFESAVHSWIDALLGGDSAAAISEFVAGIRRSWELESVARKAITLLCPGVGDIYQGTEWWDDSLVDPDNRRPVDYRRPLDGPKTTVVRHALALRTRHPAAFGVGGTYLRLSASGPAAEHVVAFGRGHDDSAEVVVLAARFTHSLDHERCATTSVALPAGRWRDVADDSEYSGSIPLSTAMSRTGVTLLERV
ncbi:malto-oligosyltrehalose synthase [Gordonia soli]|uniref:Malto-oligosyltrehalose synthase n=1 Tax=Gordonia soli NBRC 108243 TaxID=1223545 RepID=M0QN50_9ACTN|nr:malto-oligosyltrehalose synthase [Gordonia soli]GAC69998.1 malto-oligosyltrehalose synthase [Gordonia soli NBRC 108243]